MSVNDSISKSTEQLLARNYKLKRSKSTKHRKELMVEDNYNYLQYLGVTRIFLQSKYKLSFEDVELLLYLYGKNFFTKKDYRRFPMSWSFKRFNKLVNEDFIVKVTLDPERTRGCVFMLSIKAKNMVKDFHKMLSGEKPIPTCPQHNPIFRKETNPYRRTARAIMIEMREILSDQNRWD